MHEPPLKVELFDFETKEIGLNEEVMKLLRSIDDSLKKIVTMLRLLSPYR